MRLHPGTRQTPSLAGLVLLTASWACGLGPVQGSAPPSGPGDADLAILFIGNSLTFANHLPAIVEALLDAAGVDAAVSSVALPNAALEDHWNGSGARAAIGAGGWDWVVLQQGPSATEGRPSLLEYSQRFAPEVRRSGAEPALYMVWPSRARSRDFDGVFASYSDAARRVDGVFLPAGDAWRRAWAEDPSLQLYGRDGFHPAALGSYLAALTIVDGLTGISALDLPASIDVRTPSGRRRLTVPEPTAGVLRRAARSAVEAARGGG